MKKIIVINGRGGVGKDTFINVLKESKQYANKIANISSIEPIRKSVNSLIGGYGGEVIKDNKYRKLLSDVKRALIEYNDMPTLLLHKEVVKFVNNENLEYLFVHIREPEEIEKFVKTCKQSKEDIITLLIRNTSKGYHEKTYGNYSDDNVENYKYDYIFNNFRDINEERTKEIIINFFTGITV